MPLAHCKKNQSSTRAPLMESRPKYSMLTQKIEKRKEIHHCDDNNSEWARSVAQQNSEELDHPKSNHCEESSDKEQSQTEKTNESFKNNSGPGANDSVRSDEQDTSSQHEHTNSIIPKSAFYQFISLRSKTILLAALIALIAVLYLGERGARKCSFSKLQKHYPKEDESLWKHLQFGNEDILNNKSDKPAVFLFLHHGKSTAGNLIKEIAQTSASCFGSSGIIENIDFTSKEAIDDYGHVIEKYSNSIKEGNVVFIANVNKIPAEAAKALHAICDTVTPLVKKVIILLSLRVEEEYKNVKVTEIAENKLSQLWEGKIGRNELDPIITRVTDQVFLLKSNKKAE